MAGHAYLREVRDDELEAVLALWREAYGTVGVTDSLDDVLQHRCLRLREVVVLGCDR